MERGQWQVFWRVAQGQTCQWDDVYAFVCPTAGATWRLLLPSVRAEWYSLALAAFAQAVGAGPGRQVLLLIEQAGWHLSHDVQVPDGLHLVPLPPYSPELQPAERLWALSDEPLINRTFTGIGELEGGKWRAVPSCRPNPLASTPSPSSRGGPTPPD